MRRGLLWQPTRKKQASAIHIAIPIHFGNGNGRLAVARVVAFIVSSLIFPNWNLKRRDWSMQNFIDGAGEWGSVESEELLGAGIEGYIR